MHPLYFLGRFCIMPHSQWPTTNFKSIVSAQAGFVDVAPFEVSPALFELRPGEVVPIEIRFRPEVEGVFEEKMTLVCDNCCVKHFTLTGKGVGVNVKMIEVGGLTKLGMVHTVT